MISPNPNRCCAWYRVMWAPARQWLPRSPVQPSVAVGTSADDAFVAATQDDGIAFIAEADLVQSDRGGSTQDVGAPALLSSASLSTAAIALPIGVLDDPLQRA